MGSHMKKVIFEEQTADALQRWQKNAKKKVKRQRKSDHPSSGLASRSVLSSGVQSGETTPTQIFSIALAPQIQNNGRH